MKKLKPKSKPVPREIIDPSGAFAAIDIGRIIQESVHETPPVCVEPDISLTRWSLYQVIWPSTERTRHLVGWALYEARVSTAVLRIDLERMTALTSSGRHYQLEGMPARDSDAQWVYGIWLDRSGCRHHRDMTRALMHTRLASTSRKPYDFKPTT
jgi:hypothetical protein